jgi:hypothetical protein
MELLVSYLYQIQLRTHAVLLLEFSLLNDPMSDQLTFSQVIPTIKYSLMFEKILSHLNTKNDDIVDILPPQSRSKSQIRLFE